MPAQNYETHVRRVPFYVGVAVVVQLTIVGAGVNLWKSIGDHSRLYSASLLVVLAACLLLVQYFARAYALRAQDRAIRAEENLRHYVLTGKLLDPRLGIRQIVGLRFASDGEFPELARRAAEEGLSEDAIKRAVKHWRADEYRV